MAEMLYEAMTATSDLSSLATLSYLKKDPRYIDEKPYRLINIQSTIDLPEKNLQFEDHEVPVTDLRHQKSAFTLDANGFQLFDWPSNISMEAEYEAIESYCKEMADRLHKELGAEKVFVYEFRFRSKDLSTGHFVLNVGSAAKRFPGNPAQVVHTDHSQRDGLGRVHKHLTEDEAKMYLSGKYYIRCINTWRSFNATSQDMPLALCMPSSVEVGDIQAIDKVTLDVCSESYYLHHNRNHRWFWASDMHPSEALVFTTWDSRSASPGEATKCTFHSAFPNPIKGDHSPREGLEVRMIIINKLKSE